MTTFLTRTGDFFANLQRKQNYGAFLYYFALLIYIVSQYVHISSMFTIFVPSLIINRIAEVAGGLVILKILLFDRDKFPNWQSGCLATALGLLLWTACVHGNTYDLFYYYVFILGAWKMNYRQLLKFFIWTMTICLLVTIVAAKVGIIPGLTIGRKGLATVRYALGTNYPTDLAAKLYYLMLSYTVLKRFKLRLPELISLIALAVFTYVTTDTKLDVALMLLLILVVIFYKQIVSFLQWLGSAWIITISYIVIAVSILMAYFYTLSNVVLRLANKVLSKRLYYQHEAFKKYNVTLFGQSIPQRGNGGLHGAIYNYFYIDSSYVRILMMFGFVAFVIAMALVAVMIVRGMNRRAYALVLFTIFVLASSIIDHHMFQLSFDFVFIALLANTSFFENEDNLENFAVFRRD